MGYREDLNINKFSLDNEWLKQPGLYCDYARQAAEAEDERDRAKEKIALKEAEVGLAIRKDPTKYGLTEKSTETAIRATLVQNAELIQLNSDYLDLVKKAKVLGIAVVAFEHKKRALTKLTDLHLAGYWSQSSSDSPAGKMAEKAVETAGAEQRAALSKSPRLMRKRES